jgi:hypothetical protein
LGVGFEHGFKRNCFNPCFRTVVWRTQRQMRSNGAHYLSACVASVHENSPLLSVADLARWSNP